MDGYLAIGDVAKATGFPITSLRYYEEVGVISPSHRVGGKRRFDFTIIDRLAFLRRAQAAGFSLEEIRFLLEGSNDWHDLVERKLNELVERRAELDSMIESLTELKRCRCEAAAACNRVTT